MEDREGEHEHIYLIFWGYYDINCFSADFLPCFLLLGKKATDFFYVDFISSYLSKKCLPSLGFF
jgi:hypothetical protein